jgi:hypothetical protein
MLSAGLLVSDPLQNKAQSPIARIPLGDENRCGAHLACMHSGKLSIVEYRRRQGFGGLPQVLRVARDDPVRAPYSLVSDCRTGTGKTRDSAAATILRFLVSRYTPQVSARKATDCHRAT